MAVDLLLELKGATLAQYDQGVGKMELGGKTAPAGLCHWVTATEVGSGGRRAAAAWGAAAGGGGAGAGAPRRRHGLAPGVAERAEPRRAGALARAAGGLTRDPRSRRRAQRPARRIRQPRARVACG